LLACLVSTASVVITAVAIGRFSDRSVPLYSSPLIEVTGDFCELPLLTKDTLKQHADEINEAAVTRVRLDRFDAWHDGGDAFREFCSLCPQLVEINLVGWQIREEDLLHALKVLPGLQHLNLTMTRVLPGNVDWGEHQFSLTSFALTSPRNLTDEMATDWLSAMPKLQRLIVSGTYPRGKRDLHAWPWESLRNLDELTIHGSADDAIVERIVATLPKLRALRLSECEAVTANTWTHKNWMNLKKLSISRCPNVTIEATNTLLKQTLSLETLNLSFFDIDQTAAVDLTPLSSLRDLDLYVRERPVGISKQKHLEALSVRRAGHIDWSPLNLRPLSRLRSLSLFSTHQEETLLHLSPSIRHLELVGLTLSHAAVKTILLRQTNLESVTLNDLYASLKAIDREESSDTPLDFSRLTQLRELTILNCWSLSDQVMASVSRQVPSLEQLRLLNNKNLTGDGWDLSKLASLRQLEFSSEEKLLDATLKRLPTSLESLRVHRCPKLTGDQMDFGRLPRLKSLSITDCELTTIGSTLPTGLQELNMWECLNWTGRDLDFSTIGQMRSMNFRDCRKLNADKVLAAVTRHAQVLQSLNLNGCPSPGTMNWDLSHLRNSLRVIDYAEGDPSYFGGIDDTARERM